MASSKEILQTSRPLTHRPSISSASASGGLSGARQSHARANSHSIINGSLNPNHRVTRRKSMTNSATNVAAVAAALQEAGDQATPLPIAISSRRNTMSKSGISRSAIVGSLPSPPASLPLQKFLASDAKPDTRDSAIDDELNDMSGDDGDDTLHKARVRRASDGQPLVKEGRKSNRPELRCETCGKGYKHSSCLTKHLWEHTPEWSYTSKLLISKHQQVQLLEAASVLVAMNTDSTTPPDSARDFASDQDSTSPAASPYSDPQDRSSVDTTPPPQLGEPHTPHAGNYRSLSKRYSSGSGFSRSYQSAPSGGSIAGSIPNTSGFGHFRHPSTEIRPPSSGRNATSQDDQELANAVELLSCSFGSNSGARTVHLPADAPPVPPLPAQYLDQAALVGTSFISSFANRAPESFTRGELHGHRDDVKMEESGESVADDNDDDFRSTARSDEDDDGVFGRMEE